MSAPTIRQAASIAETQIADLLDGGNSPLISLTNRLVILKQVVELGAEQGDEKAYALLACVDDIDRDAHATVEALESLCRDAGWTVSREKKDGAR